MNHDVFISYSSKNKHTADAICHVLEQHKIKCWIAPRDISIGQKYGDVIEEAIRNCKVFIIVFSKESSRAPWVESELNIAFSDRRIIMPFRIDNTNLGGGMRLMLNDKHWIDAYPNPEKYFGEICESVKRILPQKIEENIVIKDSEPNNDFESCVRVAEQGNVDAQWNLGYMYEEGQGVPQNYAKAMEWYLKAAEQGDAGAQWNLGYMYEKGQGVPQNYAKAAEWFTKAAEQGDAESQWCLGYMHEKGQGMPLNYVKAKGWYLKAAEQGHAIAQCSLGFMYEYGRGVSQDYAKAMGWYLKAAEQNNAPSQHFLGSMYYNGRGVTKNYAMAVEWFTKAAKQGNDNAIKALQNIKVVK